MNIWSVAWKGSRFHWRANLAVAMGAAAGTAVLTGALIVGDSVRSSLKQLTLERLGKIDVIVLSEQFFRAELAVEVESAESFQSHFRKAIPAIVFPGLSVEHRNDQTRRVNGATVVGCSSDFWTYASAGGEPPPTPGFDQIVINQPLAEDLDVAVGDRIIVRLSRETGIAADSVLARKDDRTRNLANLEVIAIIPAEGLGRFSLQATQRTPRTAFLGLDVLQDALDQHGKLNAVLITSDSLDREPTEQAVAALRDAIRPTLVDLGIKLTHVRRTWHPNSKDAPEQTALEYLSLSTERMLFPAEVDEALQDVLAPVKAQPVMTYSANIIQKLPADEDTKGIPYSIITAIDSQEVLGPLIVDGKPLELGDDEMVLNSWAAKDQGATIGDEIRITFYEPETTHGDVKEQSATFRVRAIAPIVEPDEPFQGDRPALFTQRPTLANDPDLTPVVEGVSDQDSISNWDAPFPVDMRLIRDQDDVYWKNHRTTPKAFVSLATGRRLWESRFGGTTSYRIPLSETLNEAALKQEIERALQPRLSALGFSILEAKRDGLRASQGTTPFNLLFLGFSFFIVAAALMLVSLLFRLGLEQRAEEIGILLALGLRPRKVASIFTHEGLITTLVGCGIGCAAGVGYAWLMLAGLRTWWLDAVVTPFLNLHVTPISLLIGLLSGIIASLATIVWTAWRLSRRSARQLIVGEVTDVRRPRPEENRWLPILSVCLLAFSLILSCLALGLAGEAQAGAFFGAGFCVLTAALIYVWHRLRVSGSTTSGESTTSLSKLAARNLARNPLRSALTIGLMAAACFLIVAISAFRLQPTESGVGGFSLICESDQPIFENLDDASVREDVFGADAEALNGARVISLRLKEGDDASCRNLYQSRRPRMLGVTEAMMNYFDDMDVPRFDWAGSLATPDQPNPWRALEINDDERVPVILDKNTAMYSLHLYGGVGEPFELDYGDGQTIKFRVAGLLSNSVLQGNLLVSERQLLRHFPRVGGFRSFLVRTDDPSSATSLLEDTFSDQGLDAKDTSQVLADLLAVQNTYLSTFQSLGGLGLLLGTFGLAAVQLRNVVERRRELAILRATGFRRARLSTLVLLEHAMLLLAGLAVGVLAALVAVLPHMLAGGASVPWPALAMTLTLVLIVGFVTGMFAVRGAMRTPVLAALRGK